MLSIANVTNAGQAASYFSRDDYYLDREHRQPSAWWGRGAECLGLSGEVKPDDFRKLLSRELPAGCDGASVAGKGVAADAATAAKNRRVGIDLTFSAPKSVSLMALVGGDTRLAQAHDKAVEIALTYMQDEASITRATADKQTSLQRSGNFIVARFQHDTSRHQDPQMHSHCVVMNLTRRQDGAWRALSNEAIYRHKMVAGAIYRAELAYSLQKLGYGIDKQHADGRFELAGFDKQALEVFSKRRVEIAEALQKSHHANAKTAARVTLMTRQAKHGVDRAALRDTWQKEAEQAGIDFTQICEGFERQQQLHRATPAQALTHAVDHLTERDVRCDTVDLIRHSLGRGMGFVRYHDIKRAIALEVSRGKLLPAEAPQLQEDRGARYTTGQMLDLERKLIGCLQSGRNQYQAILNQPPELRPGDGGRELTAGQKKAVATLLTSIDAIVGVQGYAGTGKTTMLEVVKQHAQANGYALSGFATSAAAAEVIETQTGIKSRTIARHLADVHRGETAKEGRHASKPPIWVVDELSMVGNRDALALFQAAQRRGARLFLLGDKDQLPSIAAGRVFDLLMTNGMKTATMTDIVRQSDRTIKQAVTHAIAGRSAESLALVQATEDKDLQKMTQTYLQLSKEERQEAMMVVLTHASRQTVCTTVRQSLRAEKELIGVDTPTSILVKQDFTRAQMREAVHYDPGHVVRFGRDYKSAGVTKGSYWRVAAADIATNTIQLEGASGKVAWQPHRADRVELYAAEPRSLAQGDRIRWTRNDDGQGRRNGQTAQVIALDASRQTATVVYRGKHQQIDLRQAGHWEHAYVSTLASAQGATAKQVFLYLQTQAKSLVGLEAWYVGISRAKARLSVYTDDLRKLPAVIARSMQKHSALQQHESGRRVRNVPSGIDKAVDPVSRRHSPDRVTAREI